MPPPTTLPLPQPPPPYSTIGTPQLLSIKRCVDCARRVVDCGGGSTDDVSAASAEASALAAKLRAKPVTSTGDVELRGGGCADRCAAATKREIAMSSTRSTAMTGVCLDDEERRDDDDDGSTGGVVRIKSAVVVRATESKVPAGGDDEGGGARWGSSSGEAVRMSGVIRGPAQGTNADDDGSGGEGAAGEAGEERA
jgi:hypothetical protein